MMTRMGDDAFAKPSGLPDWTRAHVLTHVARNADAMVNLLTWARTGVPTPAYASRDAARRGHRDGCRAHARGDPRRPDRVVGPARRRRAGDAGGGVVGARRRHARPPHGPAVGRPVAAGARGVDPRDRPRRRRVVRRPAPADAARAAHRRRRDARRPARTSRGCCWCPATSRGRGRWGRWPRIGRGTLEVRGPAAELAAWLLGRSKGRDLRTAEGKRAAGAAAMALTSTNGAHPGSGAYPDFAALRAEFGLPDGFPPAVLAEAAAAAAARPAAGPGPGRRHGRRAGDDRPARVQGPRPGRRRRPPGRRLPRALRHRRPRRRGRAGRGAGHRGAPPRADGVPARRVGAAAPAGAVRGRGEPAARTVRGPPCCGASTSTAQASRCPSTCVARWSGPARGSTTPACRPTVDAGAIHPAIAALPEVGPLRRALAVRRGAIELELPEQEVVRAARPAGGWTVQVRQRTPVEDWNAEISLLTGMTAARIMLDAGIGVLRTLPAAEPDAVDALREVARGLGIDWPAGATPGRAAVRAAPRTRPLRWPCAGPRRRCSAAPATPRSTPRTGPRRRPMPDTPGSGRRTRT